jgi:hypothetical protein
MKGRDLAALEREKERRELLSLQLSSLRRLWSLSFSLSLSLSLSLSPSLPSFEIIFIRSDYMRDEERKVKIYVI